MNKLCTTYTISVAFLTLKAGRYDTQFIVKASCVKRGGDIQ